MEIYFFYGCLVFFVCALISSTIFRVKDINYGLPSSVFKGRLSGKKDKNGFSIPIREPYKEGLHIKWPWWRVEERCREVKTKVIERKEYPTGDGGFVIISGIIQYRPSYSALYRYVEVQDKGIEEGLVSELDQVIGTELGTMTTDDALSKRKELSENLSGILRGSILNPRDVDVPDIERVLFGKKLSYSEHSYGIEVLKSNIDVIDVPESLKEDRVKMTKEDYQKRSETTEWDHLLARMKSMKIDFPNLDDKLILEAVQVWQKQVNKDVKEFKINDLKSIIEGLGSKIFKVKGD